MRFDPRRELDEVIGKYDEGRGNLLQRCGRIAVKALIGASLAIAAATLVIYTLHSHVKQAQTAPGPKKPVQVQIVPAQK